jgi:hypothetical protein
VGKIFFIFALVYGKILNKKGASKMSRRNERKVVLFLVFFALAVVICPWNALGDAQMWIESVDIVPSVPTETDEITFDISGWAYQKPSWVDHNEFSQDGSTLQLDLYINKGDAYSFSEWTYLKLIPALPADNYILQINAIDYDGSVLRDTYLFEFTVVPEPATFLLLLFGATLLRKRG